MTERQKSPEREMLCWWCKGSKCRKSRQMNTVVFASLYTSGNRGRHSPVFFFVFYYLFWTLQTVQHVTREVGGFVSFGRQCTCHCRRVDSYVHTAGENNRGTKMQQFRCWLHSADGETIGEFQTRSALWNRLERPPWLQPWTVGAVWAVYSARCAYVHVCVCACARAFVPARVGPMHLHV